VGKAINLVILLTAIVVISCATYEVIESMTVEKDYKIYRMNGNSVPRSDNQLGNYSQFSFNCEILISTNNLENKYYISLKFLVQNGFRVNIDSPLTLTVDGEIFEFSEVVAYHFNPERIKMNNTYYYLEAIRYQVLEETLYKLSNASVVEYYIQGENKQAEVRLSQENIERIKSFFEEYNI